MITPSPRVFKGRVQRVQQSVPKLMFRDAPLGGEGGGCDSAELAGFLVRLGEGIIMCSVPLGGAYDREKSVTVCRGPVRRERTQLRAQPYVDDGCVPLKKMWWDEYDFMILEQNKTAYMRSVGRLSRTVGHVRRRNVSRIPRNQPREIPRRTPPPHSKSNCQCSILLLQTRRIA